MSDMPQFQFHPRCKDLRLTCILQMIWFSVVKVNSVLFTFYCKLSNYSPIPLVYRIINKILYFCHGIPDSDIQRIVQASGFTRSMLPFRYLWVPICSKKISVSQFGVLVDKITARIKTWSSRNLSYTIRVQLINSVLLTLRMYWAQIYILPKNILREITKICRAFLWSGKAYSSKPSNISWEKTFCNKQVGGLGFRDVLLWNTENTGKYVWALATKQDNIWTK